MQELKQLEVLCTTDLVTTFGKCRESKWFLLAFLWSKYMQGHQGLKKKIKKHCLNLNV